MYTNYSTTSTFFFRKLYKRQAKIYHNASFTIFTQKKTKRRKKENEKRKKKKEKKWKGEVKELITM